MMNEIPSGIDLDADAEAYVKQRLVQSGGSTRYAEMLLGTGGFISRFLYLQSVLGSLSTLTTRPMLVSGFSVGSEMIVARQFGFQVIDGVEVDPFLLELCQRRIAHLPCAIPRVYDGLSLPYDDNRFGLIVSGHVIEHTSDPARYLSECMRVLQPNGFLSLEFPTRYHLRELHYEVLPVEWLPRPLRSLVLWLLSSRLVPLTKSVRGKYRGIRRDRLQPIGLRDVRRMLARSGHGWVLIASTKAAPGIVRCMIQKVTSAALQTQLK